jgi:hypothetical protein
MAKCGWSSFPSTCISFAMLQKIARKRGPNREARIHVVRNNGTFQESLFHVVAIPLQLVPCNNSIGFEHGTAGHIINASVLGPARENCLLRSLGIVFDWVTLRHRRETACTKDR